MAGRENVRREADAVAFHKLPLSFPFQGDSHPFSCPLRGLGETFPNGIAPAADRLEGFRFPAHRFLSR